MVPRAYVSPHHGTPHTDTHLFVHRCVSHRTAVFMRVAVGLSALGLPLRSGVTQEEGDFKDCIYLLTYLLIMD